MQILCIYEQSIWNKIYNLMLPTFKQNPERLQQGNLSPPTSPLPIFNQKQLKARKQSASYNISNRSKINLNQLTAKLEGMEKRIQNREVLSPSNLRVRGRAGTVAIMHRPSESSRGQKVQQNNPNNENENDKPRADNTSLHQGKQEDLKVQNSNKMSSSAFISKVNADSVNKQSKQRSSHGFGLNGPKHVPGLEMKNKQEENDLTSLKAKLLRQIHQGHSKLKTECSATKEQEMASKESKYNESINKSIYILEMMKSKQSNKNSLKIKTKRSLSIQVSVLRGFSFGQILGKGKFGQVYLAKHNDTGALVAIKKIGKSKLKQLKLIDQFIKEIKLHSSLDHPKIVKFYGFFQEKEDIYLVLEYMNGGTLFEYMNSVGRLSMKEAVDILKDVAEGLNYMHDRSIAHRDIKPENIVISSGVAKLCDFGWASVICNPRSTYCGTLDYASPEILERKKYDLSVDIWSLGVLTYEMLMGNAPFDDKDRSLIKQKILNVDKSSLAYSDQVSEQARSFIELLMQKEPAMRPKIDKLLSHQLFSTYGSKGSKKTI